jgi:hypothetical protein
VRTELADDLLGVVAFVFHGASPGQVWPLGEALIRASSVFGVHVDGLTSAQQKRGNKISFGPDSRADLNTPP